ncbi:hypothetical protein COCVIDRAFT_115896 [Bipolaris victoriae FI3]|uniref:DUF6536 domain-containing protein n=1 Tax=Bipolaris victoriae (strain FI3) TaxID=930091 RepID=W7DXG3_BIPV3|nr:hypothetical protein COCVIDRAFT_115896 [Bipolaris victoriae FI3]
MLPVEEDYESSACVTRPLFRPPTPGPIFNSAGALLSQPQFSQNNSSSASYRTSRDIATLRTDQSEWIYLDEVPPDDEDHCNYENIDTSITSTRSRLLSESNTSYNGQSSTHAQGSFQKCPLSSFQYPETTVSGYQSCSRFYGWRMSMLMGSCTSAAILAFNIVVVVLVAIKPGFNGDTAVLPFTYDSVTMHLSSGIHILINALSTILLGASNFTMQVLTSYVVCYNSAAIFIASTNLCSVYVLNVTSPQWQDVLSSPNYTALSNLQWQKAYQSQLIDYGDLYLAINQTALKAADGDTEHPTLSFDSNYTWVMQNISRAFVRKLILNETDKSILSRNRINMTAFNSDGVGNEPYYGQVTAARARIVSSRSRIQISLCFLIIVIISNAIKLATMLWVLFYEEPEFLVTLGDAATSFLKSPDPQTEGVCVYSREAILIEHGSGSKKSKQGNLLEDITHDSYGTWRERYHSYSLSLGRDREVGSSFM